MTGTTKSGAQLAIDADGIYATAQGDGAITAARVRQFQEDVSVTIGAAQTAQSTDASNIAAIQAGASIGLLPSGGDDTAAFQARVTALQSAGGGVLRLQDGATYSVSAATSITASNITVIGYNVTILLTGSTSFAAFDFEGSGVLSHPALNTNAAAYATAISVTAITAGLTAGAWLLIQKDAPNNGGAAALYSFVAKVRSISGGGPFTVNLESALPIAFATADAGLLLSVMGMLSNVGVVGSITFDGTSASGTTVHGVKAASVVGSQFQGINGINLITGAALYMQFGHGNDVRSIAAENCGSSTISDVFLIAQTGLAFNAIRSYRAAGFGPQLQSVSYCCGSNLISEGAQAGRGVKFQASLFGRYSNTQGHRCADNGIAVSVGSVGNVFMGAAAHANLQFEGFWFSDQYNTGNYVIGLSAHGNASRDIYVGTTDTGNTFLCADADVIVDNPTSTTWFGGPSNNGAAWRLPKAAGSASDRWVGGDGSGSLWLNAPSGASHYLTINNTRRLQVTNTAILADVEVAPQSDGGANLGDATHRWNVLNLATQLLLQTRSIDFNTAAPVAGTYVQGSRRYNASATVGQPLGWVCTVGGTPGTWVAMANL